MRNLMTRERFEQKIEVQGICWAWLGPSRIWIAERKNPVRPHVAALILFDRPIPPGMVTRSLCDHEWCVNPDHRYFLSEYNDQPRRGQRSILNKRDSLTDPDFIRARLKVMRQLQGVGTRVGGGG